MCSGFRYLDTRTKSSPSEVVTERSIIHQYSVPGPGLCALWSDHPSQALPFRSDKADLAGLTIFSIQVLKITASLYVICAREPSRMSINGAA